MSIWGVSSVIVEDGAEVCLAYIGRALLPAKVRAFVDHAAEFLEDAVKALAAIR